MVEHDEILAALTARRLWEDRQSTWYQMRHDGLRRANKPWPNAADMHFPLGDMMIEKLKPFYVSQIFATETVASFIGMDGAAASYASAAAQWFDYALKQQSNFEHEIVVGADRMLQSGKCPIKCYWDADRTRLTFESINPLYLIVPPWTGRLAEADWVVHIQHYSKHAYKRLGKPFDTSDETIKAITEGETATNTYEQQRKIREGLTHGRTADQIVVWEVFARDDSGQWTVKTYSPTAPSKPLRPDFGLPYNQGIFAEKTPPPPFFELSAEVKDRGYYDARGIMERVAPFEASLCKDWNTQKDYQTLTCAPQFYAEQGVPNTGNLTMKPGSILPFKLEAVQMPPIPMDIAASMQGTRSVAEQVVALPDFGTGNGNGQDKPKTAREVSLIANVMGQGVDLRSRIFRRELAHGLNLAWSVLVQYSATALDYFVRDAMKQLPADALGARYRIEPNASGDNWNRTLILQKAQSRFQMFKGDPRIDQDELYRSLLDADDARLTLKLLVNSGSQQAMQVEDQAQEISIMLLGFPAEVRPTDDHLAHLQSLMGFVQRRLAMNEPVTPECLQLAAQHATAHAQAAKEANPGAWKQAAPQVVQFIKALSAAAQQAAQQQQQAQAQAVPQGMPPQGQPPMQPMPPQGQPPAMPVPSLQPTPGQFPA